MSDKKVIVVNAEDLKVSKRGRKRNLQIQILHETNQKD